MSENETIHVKLVNEGTDVWRPVQAQRRYGNIYKIIEQEYDEDDEKWEFEPGATVECAHKVFNDGSEGMVPTHALSFRQFKATHQNKSFVIKEDLPKVGFYVFVYDKDGNGLYDYLQNTEEIAKDFAFERWQVPVDSWIDITDETN